MLHLHLLLQYLLEKIYFISPSRNLLQVFPYSFWYGTVTKMTFYKDILRIFLMILVFICWIPRQIGVVKCPIKCIEYECITVVDVPKNVFKIQQMTSQRDVIILCKYTLKYGNIEINFTDHRISSSFHFFTWNVCNKVSK